LRELDLGLRGAPTKRQALGGVDGKNVVVQKVGQALTV